MLHNEKVLTNMPRNPLISFFAWSSFIVFWQVNLLVPYFKEFKSIYFWTTEESSPLNLQTPRSYMGTTIGPPLYHFQFVWYQSLNFAIQNWHEYITSETNNKT